MRGLGGTCAALRGLGVLRHHPSHALRLLGQRIGSASNLDLVRLKPLESSELQPLIDRESAVSIHGQCIEGGGDRLERLRRSLDCGLILAHRGHDLHGQRIGSRRGLVENRAISKGLAQRRRGTCLHGSHRFRFDAARIDTLARANLGFLRVVRCDRVGGALVVLHECAPLLRLRTELFAHPRMGRSIGQRRDTFADLPDPCLHSSAKNNRLGKLHERVVHGVIVADRLSCRGI